MEELICWVLVVTHTHTYIGWKLIKVEHIGHRFINFRNFFNCNSLQFMCATDGMGFISK
jgi:hypothetical protein